jgi:hypothetical protein
MTPGTYQPEYSLYFHIGTDDLSDGSTIALFGAIPAVLFNPGDITYADASRPYYQNLSGDYYDLQNGLDYDGYGSLTDGVAALAEYLQASVASVGWVERSETHHFLDTAQQSKNAHAAKMGFADAQPILQFLQFHSSITITFSKRRHIRK